MYLLAVESTHMILYLTAYILRKKYMVHQILMTKSRNVFILVKAERNENKFNLECEQNSDGLNIN